MLNTKKVILIVFIIVIITVGFFYYVKKSNEQVLRTVGYGLGLSEKEQSFLEKQGLIGVQTKDVKGIVEVRFSPSDLIKQNFDSIFENFEVLATKLDLNQGIYQLAFRLENLAEESREFYLIPVSEKSQLDFENIQGLLNGKKNILIDKTINKSLSELFDTVRHRKELRPELSQAYQDIQSGKYESEPIKIVLGPNSYLTATSNWKVYREQVSENLEPVYFLIYGSSGGVKDKLSALTVYSKLTKEGNNWEIYFKTKGTANLSIAPLDNQTKNDLSFISLECNNQAKTPEVLEGIISFSNWNCKGKGRITYNIKKEDDHQLQFQFGGSREIAEADYRKIHGEFLVYIGEDPSGSFEKGDIVHAINIKRILDVYAQHITHPKNASKNSSKRREKDCLLDIYLQNTKEYKFERISEYEIRRTNLLTGEQDILSNTPNQDNEYIDVPRYIERRLKNDVHQIFGEPGSEYWYGGNTRITLEKLDNIWQEIELRTDYKKKDYMEFQFSSDELKNYFAITTDDFTDEEAAEYTSSIIDSEGNVLKEKKYKVDFDSLAGIPLDQLKYKTKIKDYRDKKFDRNKVIKIK